jgi:hypothetical protein
MDRRELLELDKPERPLDDKRLNKSIDEGVALAHMLDTRGWKLLYTTYIEPRLSMDAFLNAPQEKLHEVQVTMKTLKDLVNFIENRIKDGSTSFEKIQKHKEE